MTKDDILTSSSDSETSDPLILVSPPASPTTSKAYAASSNDETLATLDRFLNKYVAYMKSALHQDRAFKFLQWTLWLLSAVSSNSNKNKTAFRKLYLDICYSRYASRLLAWPTAIEAARSNSWACTSRLYPKLHKCVGQVMAWSMVGYYPCEVMAYLQWMVPSWATTKRSAEKWSYLSCRFWLLYVVAEAVQCAALLKEMKQQELDKDGDDNPVAKKEQQLALRNTKLQLVRDALFFLPCLQWSLPNWDTDPWLSENFVNMCMWIESVVCFQL
jgi:hypothetical protein